MHLPDHVSNSKHDSPTDFSRFKRLRDRIVKPQLAQTTEKSAPSQHAIFWNLNIYSDYILPIWSWDARQSHCWRGGPRMFAAFPGGHHWRRCNGLLAQIFEDIRKVEVLLTEWLLFRMGLHAVQRNWLWTPLCEFSRGKALSAETALTNTSFFCCPQHPYREFKKC